MTPPLPWESLGDRSPVAARIAAAVARDIATGAREPGTLLTEVEVAAANGASRTPAREAMLQLEAWGLVRIAPKKGAVVTAVTAAERRDLLDVRALFEISAVEAIAAGRGDLSGFADAASDLLEAQRADAAASDALAFAGHDFSFHAALIAAGGNAVVARMLDTLGPRLARLTYSALTERPSSLGTLLAEHEALAERARSGDAAGFADLVRRHIGDTHFGGTHLDGTRAADEASDTGDAGSAAGGGATA